MKGAVTQADADRVNCWMLGQSKMLGEAEYNSLAEAFARHREAETERCAKVAEDWNRHPKTNAVHETSANIAQSIRSTPGDVL